MPQVANFYCTQGAESDKTLCGKNGFGRDGNDIFWIRFVAETGDGKMKGWRKKLLGFLLCVALVIGLVPEWENSLAVDDPFIIISYNVTFKSVNGALDDKGNTQYTVVLSRREDEDLLLTLSEKDIPKPENPDLGYKKEGSWDVVPTTERVISRDVVYTYTYPATGITYDETDAQGAEHVSGSGEDAVFTFKCNDGQSTENEKFRSITMDGELVSEENYTHKKGSLILTLKGAYLDTLSEGEHNLKVNFTDGSAAATIQMKAAAPTPTPAPTAAPTAAPTPTSVPKTGDEAAFPLWVVLLIVGLAGLGFFFVKKSKGK